MGYFSSCTFSFFFFAFFTVQSSCLRKRDITNNNLPTYHNHEFLQVSSTKNTGEDDGDQNSNEENASESNEEKQEKSEEEDEEEQPTESEDDNENPKSDGTRKTEASGDSVKTSNDDGDNEKNEETKKDGESTNGKEASFKFKSSAPLRAALNSGWRIFMYNFRPSLLKVTPVDDTPPDSGWYTVLTNFNAKVLKTTENGAQKTST